MGKGGNDRIVPLDTGRSRFSKRLATYVRTVRPTDAEDRHLFLSGRGDPKPGGRRPRARRGVRMVLRRVGNDTGIHVHRHKFRHTFATGVWRRVDSLALQRALGHSTLAVVNRYAQLQGERPARRLASANG